MGCMTFLFRNVLSRSLCNVRIVSIRKGGLLWFCLGYLCKWMSLCLRLCFFSCQFYWAFLGFTLYYSWNPFVFAELIWEIISDFYYSWSKASLWKLCYENNKLCYENILDLYYTRLLSFPLVGPLFLRFGARY